MPRELFTKKTSIGGYVRRPRKIMRREGDGGGISSPYELVNDDDVGGPDMARFWNSGLEDLFVAREWSDIWLWP